MSTPCTVLILLDVRFNESSQLNTTLGKPTVEGQCVPRLDVDDAGRVLLLNQRPDKVVEMARQRAGSTAGESSGTLIRSIHGTLLPGGNARQGGLLCSASPAPKRHYVSSSHHQRDIAGAGDSLAYCPRAIAARQLRCTYEPT